MTTEAAHRPAGRAALRDLEFVLAADLAPDARRVVYTTRRTSAADDTISAWVAAVGDPDGRRELLVDGDPAAPLWSPDGSVVVVTTTVGQVTCFFAATAFWVAILWRTFQRLYGDSTPGYSDMIGRDAIVGDAGLTAGKVGQVRWSGANMNARLAPESEPTVVAPGGDVVIVNVVQGELIVAPKPSTASD